MTIGSTMGAVIRQSRFEPEDFVSVSDFVEGRDWNWSKLQLLVPDMVEKIKSSGVCFSEKLDYVVWQPESNGEFSFSSAWDIVRDKGVKQPVAMVIDKLKSQPKVKLFSWKLMDNVVGIDDRIRNMGFYITSICSCCCCCEESVNHLFISGTLATSLWDYFSAMLGFRVFINESPVVRIMRLWRCFSGGSVHHLMIRNIAAIVFWEIWKERCRRVYDSKKNSCSWLIKEVIMQVSHNIARFWKGNTLSDRDKDIVKVWDINVKLIPIKGIRWIA